MAELVDALRQHPLLGKPLTAQASPSPIAQLITTTDRGDIVVWNSESSDFTLLSVLGCFSPATSTVLFPEPAVEFTVEHVVAGSKSRLLLYGQHGCAVVDLPHAEELMLAKQHACRVAKLVDFPTSGKDRIIQAQWHPMSEFHVVVLTTDGCLRMYNYNEPRKPEQIFDLGHHAQTGDSSSPDVTAFDFGSSWGWEQFSCYCLSKNGDVFVLCPIIPDGCPLSVKALRALRTGEMNEMRRAFLEELLSGQRMDEQWVLSRRPPRRQELRVQGPMLLAPAAPGVRDGDGVVSVTCLASSPNVLAVGRSSGVIDILISFDGVAPAWGRGRSDEGVVSYYHYQRLELLPERAARFSPMLMSVDGHASDYLLCRHTCGIHRIHLSWMPGLKKYVESLEGPLPDLPPSTLSHLVDTRVSNERLLGSFILDSPPEGAVLITIDSSSHVASFDLKTWTPMERLKSTKSDPPAKRSDIAAEVERLRLAKEARIKLDDARSTFPDALNAETAEKFLRLCSALRDAKIVPMQRVAVVLEARHKLLDEKQRSQDEELGVVNSTQTEQRVRWTTLLQKIDQVVEYQRIAQERLTRIVKLNTRGPIVSDAEVQFRDEVKDRRSVVAAFQDKLKRMEDDLNKLLEDPVSGAGKLLRACATELANVNELASVVRALKDVSDALDAASANRSHDADVRAAVNATLLALDSWDDEDFEPLERSADALAGQLERFNDPSLARAALSVRRLPELLEGVVGKLERPAAVQRARQLVNQVGASASNSSRLFSTAVDRLTDVTNTLDATAHAHHERSYQLMVAGKRAESRALTATIVTMESCSKKILSAIAQLQQMIVQPETPVVPGRSVERLKPILLSTDGVLRETIERLKEHLEHMTLAD